MNAIDLILLVPLLWAAWRGLRKGLIVEIFSLLALFAGIYGGIHFSDYMAEWLSEETTIHENYLPVIAFAVTFIGVVVAVYFLGKSVEKVAHIAALKPLNKILGMVFSIAKFGLFLSIILIFLDPLNRTTKLVPQETIDASILYTPVKDFSLFIIPAIKESHFWESLKNKGLIPDFDQSEDEGELL
jgi:membrane protein required for colicin V production